MAKEFDYAQLDKLTEGFESDRRSVIGMLQAIQDYYHYLPNEVFGYLAKKIGVSEAQIYSVATFYENFSLVAKGKYVIKVCDGTACHVRKSVPILNQLRTELSLSEKKRTTDDLMFTIETVSCLGACGLSPVMTINDQVHPAMTPEKATELLNKIKEEEANA